MTTFIIKYNSDRFIRLTREGFIFCKDAKDAATFDEPEKAFNVIQNNIKPHLAKYCDIVEIDSETFEEIIGNKSNVNITALKAIRNTSKINCAVASMYEDINSLMHILNKLENKREDLTKKLSTVDREVTDLTHFIEFGKFNAYQAYETLITLKQKLEERRSIKNNLEFMQSITDKGLKSSDIAEVKNIFESESDKKYYPRELSILFNKK